MYLKIFFPEGKMVFHRPYEAYEYLDRIEVAQFIRQFQWPNHNEQLERRGPLVVPEVMNNMMSNMERICEPMNKSIKKSESNRSITFVIGKLKE